MSETQPPERDSVLIGRTGRVVTITLNRPDKLNAVNADMHDGIVDALRWAARDEESDVIVLTGAGKAFCAGGDVKGMTESPTGTNVQKKPWEVHLAGRHLVDQILWTEKPLVAQVNGAAVGLGATIALLCDVVVASETARIGDRHVNVGLVAGDGGAVIWPLLVGLNKAKELLMTGDLVTGVEAARMGLVNHAVAPDRLEEVTMSIATKLASLPKYAVRATKASVNRQLRAQVEAVLDVSLAWETISGLSEEHEVAARAFMQRRTGGTGRPE